MNFNNHKQTHPIRLLRIRVLIICLSLLPVAACIKPDSTVTIADEKSKRLFTRTLFHNDVERTYHIRLPRGFNKAGSLPLVLVLHGGGGRGRTFDQGTRGTLGNAADKRGVVLVFPEGMNKHWNDGRTEIHNKKPHDDVGFISGIIDTMIKDYGIDAGRVYATGISNGGFMSIRLALDLSAKIKAVAPVTAQLSKALEGKAPKHPVSIMIINGTKDPLVPFDGGHVRLFKFGRHRGEILSTTATIEYFRHHNGCKSTADKVMLEDRDPNDGTNVEIEQYTACREGTRVVLVKVIGGGHTWPGGKQYLISKLVGLVSRDINASEMILDFFLSGRNLSQTRDFVCRHGPRRLQGREEAQHPLENIAGTYCQI